jgi:23S rRNA pseudouridine955/2504/2580 synthase
MTLTAGADDGGRRLDRILRRALPDVPLSGIHRLLRKGRVLVDGKPAAAEDRIAAGALISIPDSATAAAVASLGPQQRPQRSGTLPLPLDILAEDPDLLFINKPAGLAVHGAESLDELVRAYLANKTGPSLSFRPGPLHRLDKPTSGLIVFSKTLVGARSFSALLRAGQIAKRYLALVEGRIPGPAVWEDLLIRDRGERKTYRAGEPACAGEAKRARTRIRPLAHGTGPAGRRGGAENFSLILAELETGRTHQIRAQAAAHGFPLAGDTKYGGAFQSGGFLLHAWTLDLPAGSGTEDRGDGKDSTASGAASTEDRGEKPRRISAPLPEGFRRRIRELFGSDAEQLIAGTPKFPAEIPAEIPAEFPRET